MTKKPQPVLTLEEAAKREQRKISRRRFLLVLGGGVGVVAVGAYLARDTIAVEARLAFNQVFLNADTPSTAPPTQPLVWFRIDADNTAHLIIPKIEMGQGIHTALAQIAADEADLAWETVRVIQADTHSGFDPEILFTFGSSSVTSLYAPIRQVAASLREMLRAEAARQTGIDAATLVASNSAFTAGERAITYGEVVAAKQGEWSIPSNARLKTPSERTLIGKSVPRVDLYAKLTGRAVYGADARVEGMAYGAVARPPRYEAVLTRASAGTAESSPGVIAVVIEPGFAGVVADSRAHARAALALLDLEWTGGTTINQAEIDARMTIPPERGTLIQRAGSVDGAAGTRIEASYYTPMAAHAHLEAQSALAEFSADGVTITTSTQAPNLTQSYIASAMQITPVENVRVIPVYVGGGFGRKAGSDVGLEAALLARGAGVPVHVAWTREEDMLYGFRRPPTRNALSGTVENGRITSIRHELISSDVLLSPEVRATFGTSGPNFFETVLGSDPLAAYGSQIHYSVPNIAVIYHHEHLPIPTAYWRGLGSFANTFAIESFIDELAFAAGADPLDFRLAHLPAGALGARFETALNRVADASGWRDGGAQEERAFGIAACYDRKTVVALVMEVSVTGGRIRAHRAWCAVDPGLVINPDGTANQVQGSVVMGLSSTFKERWTVENGLGTATNFNAYPLLTFDEAPTIEVIPIDSSDTPTGGMGEPVLGAVPAAVANAVFALTGTRVRDLPLTLA